jgi:alpha-N-arabinofuranosidase
MKWILPFILLGTLAIAPGSGAQDPNMPAIEYENPVVRGVNPDPSIIRVGEDYYLVNSSFSFYPGCPIRHSRDLVNWELIGYALTRPSQFSLDKNHGSAQLYAATLRYHDGTFYVITTDVNGGGNFYVTAKNAAGPWSDPIYIDKPQFDPSLFFDDDGTVYYTRRGPFATKDIVHRVNLF